MKSGINRRKFLGTASIAATALVTRTASAADVKTASAGPVADTAAGKVRGAVINKVNAFKGISYGASTEGANRFMPPQKPKPWTGVKDALEWGPEAPQGAHTEIPEVLATVPKGTISEDCLHLNVWTNGLKGKRPVMVWFHGGGFTSGNGSYTIYDGANMARKHDVVIVTINHRLNSFGFVYAPEAGASNAGMLDCVAALEWVRDNIANFGGDPKNVTIFGQSGGGGKVSTLLAMPSAKGLYHRAIVQSGANLRGVARDAATRTTQSLMAAVKVKTFAELQKVPMNDLVTATLNTRGLNFSPVTDGKTLPGDPFNPTAPEMSADVPLLVGTTQFEVNFFPNTNLNPIDDAALHTAFKQATRASDADVDKLIAIYRKGRPKATNVDLSQIVASDNFRTQVITETELKAAQKAPVYSYYFTWPSPVHDGKLKAFHTLEIPFVLENVDEAKTMTGTGQDRYPLQDKMSTAWAAFARTGNPNHKGLPTWPAFKMDSRSTMIFDNECKVVNDPHGEERLALAGTRPAQA
jgi:para-nitrobenzyl esterase